MAQNIIFIQMNDLALIDIENIDALIALNRVLDWQLSRMSCSWWSRAERPGNALWWKSFPNLSC